MTDDFARDWFPSGSDRNPLKAAQEAMRPALTKRFYKDAGVEERDRAFVLLLDGRVASTPARNPIAAPTRALGEAVAEEWRAQGEEIDPAAMPLTRLVNSAIDGVAANMSGVVDDIVAYLGSDLICYRAGEPERLVAEQAAAWDPILACIHADFGARFVLSEGVKFVPQPPTSVAALRARVEAEVSPFKLAALHVMAALTGSALIALAHAARRVTAQEAWAAAHVDEAFQERIWGADEEALRRRARREAEFNAASRLYALSGEASFRRGGALDLE
jgi:chaperone required for assembly of F1-ATPase